MKKNLLFFVSMLILLTLIFAAFSCSPKLERQEKRAKKKYFKALKLYPGLIDTTSKSDTATEIDTIVVHTTLQTRF